jgi:hypothetical protein
MSEGIIIALITVIGSSLGGIIGELIAAKAVRDAAALKEKLNIAPDVKGGKSNNWKAILGGTLIGAFLTLAILAFLGLLSFGGENPPTPTVVTGGKTTQNPPPSTSIPSNSSILFNDDFEDDGTDDRWTVVEGKWEVVEDTSGNHVYKGIGTFWGYTVAGSEEWKNYALEAKVKGVESSKNSGYAGIDVRVNWAASSNSCERYASRVGFTNDWIGGGKYGGNCNHDWDGRFYRVETGKWYLLRYEVVGDTLKFYIDNKLMFEEVDSDVKTGYIGLSVGENDTVYFDDVRVIGIGE